MRVADDLKPHNKETIEKILEFYETERKCCAIQATGTGKTFLILRLLEIFNDEGKVAVIFAPNREIIKQTKKRMEKFDLNNAVFYTYQKLAKMTIEEIHAIEADLIVCDELHRTGAKIWGEKFELLVDTHLNSKVFGVTATPLRCTDGRDMAEEYFDDNKACDISLAEALVREIIPVMPLYISALYTFEEEYQKMSNKINKSNNSNEEKVELQKELLAAKQQLEKANGMSEIIKKYITNYNGKYLVFCKDKKHLYAMKDVVVGWFREAGCNGNIFVYPYYSHSSEVKKNLDNFNNNKEKGIKLLFVIDKLNEGLHLEEVNGCILLRTTVSNIIYYQQIGRAIDAGSNEQRVILDLVSNFNSLKSFNLKKDLEDRILERQSGRFSDSSKEFEIDKFDVIDCVQECIDVFNQIDKNISDRWWTENDDKILLDNYYKLGAKGCEKLLNGKSYIAILTRANRLNLKFIREDLWSEDDEKILLKEHKNMNLKQLSKLLNRTERSIEARMTLLHINFDKKHTWTNSNDEYIKNNYRFNAESIKEIASHLNRTESSIRSRITKLNISRSKDSVRKSKYKYVKWDKRHNTWYVTFSVNGKSKYFGSFVNEEEAGRVALQKAKEYGKI